MLGFFNATKAVKVGSSLGDYFVEHLASRLKSRPDAQSRVVGAFLKRIDDTMAGLKLNVYTKAKLANTFKWKLLDHGVDKSVADNFTQELVLHLDASTGRRSGSKAAKTPASASAVIAVGNEHVAEGRLDQAIVSYQQALELDPKDPVTQNSLGAALFNTGRIREAESHFRTATRLKPDYAEAFNNLGNSLRELGMINESRAALRKALTIKPNYAGANANMGRTLVLLGELDAAERHNREALKVDPENADALIGLGQVISLRGDFAGAEAIYRKVLVLQPHNSAALANLVNLRKMTPQDSDWLETAERMLGTNLGSGEEAHLRFAMGKYCDDLGDYDCAFAHFKRANELNKASAASYDRKQYVEHFDKLIHHYDAACLASAKRFGSNSERPVFIVGMMRSGTSLVDQILASHTLAFGVGELGFWANAARSLDKGRHLLSPDKGRARQLANEYLELLARLAPASARRVADKQPHNFALLGLIHIIFPKARIIHVRRNPIDTCLSIYFQDLSKEFVFANDLDDLAHYYRLYEKTMLHWHATLPHGTILDVPYEDLLEQPEQWIRRMLEHIGLEWDEGCLSFYQTQRPVVTASNWQVRQKLYKTSVGRWKRYEKHTGPLIGLAEI
jgi:tetratricopeptide (TPR) repeat protein